MSFFKQFTSLVRLTQNLSLHGSLVTTYMLLIIATDSDQAFNKLDKSLWAWLWSKSFILKTFWVQTIQFWVELLTKLHFTILNRYFFIQNSSRAFEKATEGKKFYGHYVGHCFTILMDLLPIFLINKIKKTKTKMKMHFNFSGLNIVIQTYSAFQILKTFILIYLKQ